MRLIISIMIVLAVSSASQLRAADSSADGRIFSATIYPYLPVCSLAAIARDDDGWGLILSGEVEGEISQHLSINIVSRAATGLGVLWGGGLRIYEETDIKGMFVGANYDTMLYTSGDGVEFTSAGGFRAATAFVGYRWRFDPHLHIELSGGLMYLRFPKSWSEKNEDDLFSLPSWAVLPQLNFGVGFTF